MKKLFLFLVANLLVFNSFAQTDPAQLKKEGDDALKANDFATAYEKYNAYLTQSGTVDSTVIFNTAVCADKANKLEDAVKYFKKSIEIGYKTESAYVGLAKAYLELKDGANLTATVKEGLEKFPGNMNLQKLLYSYCMKTGAALQKANKFKEAEACYEQGLIITDKALKSKVLYSLGVLYYNSAAVTLQKATPLATSDPEKYKAEKADADKDFAKAAEYLEETLTISPDNANAKKILDQVKASMKQ